MLFHSIIRKRYLNLIFKKLKSKVWKIYNRNQKFTYKRIRFKLLNKIDMLNHISMKCWDSQMLSNWIYHLWLTNLKKHGIPLLLNTGLNNTSQTYPTEVFFNYADKYNIMLSIIKYVKYICHLTYDILWEFSTTNFYLLSIWFNVINIYMLISSAKNYSYNDNF